MISKVTSLNKEVMAAGEMASDVLNQQRVSPKLFPAGEPMLKLLGTIGAVAAAAVVFEKSRTSRKTDLESVAAEELRKILIYAAPPFFLAPVSTLEERHAPVRWMAKAAGN